MKNLVFATLLIGGLSQATGCIITTDDDPVEQSSFLVSWNLTAADDNDRDAPLAAIDCASAGIDTIRTVSEPDGGAQIVDLFDCVDLNKETAPLPLANYLVWVQALDGDVMVAQSFAAEASLVNANPVGVDFTFPINAGWLGLTWTLVGGDCIAGDGVSVLTTPVNGQGSFFDEIFNCVDGAATTTYNIPVDDLTVSVSLIDANDTVRGQSQPRSTSIEYGNHLVDLGNFEFDFN